MCADIGINRCNVCTVWENRLVRLFCMTLSHKCVNINIIFSIHLIVMKGLKRSSVIVLNSTALYVLYIYFTRCYLSSCKTFFFFKSFPKICSLPQEYPQPQFRFWILKQWEPVALKCLMGISNFLPQWAIFILIHVIPYIPYCNLMRLG